MIILREYSEIPQGLVHETINDLIKAQRKVYKKSYKFPRYHGILLKK